MHDINLKQMAGQFNIYRFPPKSPILKTLIDLDFFFIGKTHEELSIVTNASQELEGGQKSEGWSCFMVLGPLDFQLTGILSGLASVLAEANISIFAVSTYDTDYILVKTNQAEAARNALLQGGYHFTTTRKSGE